MRIQDHERHVASARRGLRRLVARGSARYDVGRHSGRLMARCAGHTEFGDDDRGQRLAKLAKALRHERERGRAGHWTYDLNRHIALAEAYRAEIRLLGRTGIDRDGS